MGYWKRRWNLLRYNRVYIGIIQRCVPSFPGVLALCSLGSPNLVPLNIRCRNIAYNQNGSITLGTIPLFFGVLCRLGLKV